MVERLHEARAYSCIWKGVRYMEHGYDSIVAEYVKEFENIGYTHEDSLYLAKLAARVRTINPGIGFRELTLAIEALGFTPRNKENNNEKPN